MVLDSGRTLVIWAVSLALSWQAFYPLQIAGDALVLLGMLFTSFQVREIMDNKTVFILGSDV